MLYKGRRVSRKQTRVVACGLVAPSVAVFNEAFLFDVDPRQSLTDTTVELALVDRHRVTKDEYVGKLVVSPFDGDEWGRSPGDAAGVRACSTELTMATSGGSCRVTSPACGARSTDLAAVSIHP